MLQITVVYFWLQFTERHCFIFQYFDACIIIIFLLLDCLMLLKGWVNAFAQQI